MERFVFFVGLMTCFFAYAWLLVVAFKQDILWGLGCLLIQPVAFVFLILHWDKSKKPFFASVVGAVICLIGMLIRPVFT